MHTHDPSDLAVGSPRFCSEALPQAAANEGSANATRQWQQLMETHGERLLPQVDGDFAFAVTLADGSRVAAVDRFAIQTLCYRIDGDHIRFASTADALADTDSEIDPQAIFDYLYFHCIPSPRTIYKNIFRLPPAHSARFHQGQLRVSPFWKPHFAAQPGPSFDSARSEFRELLKNAVGRELDAGLPACFLSGGTDSSTIAGMVSQASGRRASTFSIGFEAEGYDEMEFARIAAKHFNTDHHEYYVTPADLVRSIPMVAAHYDQPFGNSSALPAYYCARMAKEAGASRMLAGDGGDELYGGNSRYAKQRIFGLWQLLPSGLRTGLLEPMFMSDWAARTPGLKKAHSYVEQARVGMPARLQMYNLLLHLGVPDVLTPAFLQEVDTQGPAKHQQAVWSSIGPASELNTTLAFDWRYTLGESDLPKVRETTSLAGVSVGFPMLDNGLLDFSLRLPDDFKLKGLKLRWFFKEALRGFLPDEILSKKKQGFGLPFGVWLTRNPELLALASDSLRTLATRGIVRPDFIQALLQHKLHEHPGYFGEKIWILMMLEQWLRAKMPNYQIG